MRLDEWLVENKLVPDLFTASGLILSAKVLINDTPVTKAGYFVKEKDKIRLRTVKNWVSRGALKLKAALDAWDFPVKGKTFVDFGSSHGGFTQVLLFYGALRVAAVDVGYGILDPKIRNDKRVDVFERTHVCQFEPRQIDYHPDYFVADLSFISLRKALTCIQDHFPVWQGIVLFKPQFEVERENLQKGVVSDETSRQAAIDNFQNFALSRNIQIKADLDSPITGRDGNREVLMRLEWAKSE